MKKLILFIALGFFVFETQGQLLIKTIAAAAKGNTDTIASANTAGTTKYYYWNPTGGAQSGTSVCTTPIVGYEVASIQVNLALPIKASSVNDSAHCWFEVSNDGSNWVKWKNGSIVTNASNAQYASGAPKVFGSGAYTYVPIAAPLDVVKTTTTAGGGIFIPNNCYTPYLRVGVTSWKATASIYPKVIVVLKKL